MADLRKVFVGVLAAWWCVVASTGALAQPGLAAGLKIDGFDVEQVASLAPGTQINFSLFASPAAAASLTIDGLGRPLAMRETSRGIYELAYVVAAGDRLRPDSQVVATIRRDGMARQAVLEEPLILDWPAATPRAIAEAPPEGEVPPPSPAPRGSTPVPSAVPVLIPFPVGGTWPVALPPAPPPAAPRLAESQRCLDCARVESIRRVEAPGGAAIIGTVAGGVAGALFGDRIGEAHARHVTRVLGAVGGALLGREFAKRAERRAVYEATLRLPNGVAQVRRYDDVPPFGIGDTVRIDGAAQADARPRL